MLYLIAIFVQPKTTTALFQAAFVLGSACIIGAKVQGAFLYRAEMVAYVSAIYVIPNVYI